MTLSWIDPAVMVGHELRQLAEDGIDVEHLRQRWNAIEAANRSPEFLRAAATKFLDELGTVAPPVSETLDQIRDASNNPAVQYPLPPSVDLEDRIRGGWLGRAAGCLLGKPVEGIERDGIRKILASNGSWPLSYYITAEGVPEEILTRYGLNECSREESFRENILCMPEDDDLNYTMLNLWVLENFGMEFSTEQVAEAWLAMLPVLSTFTAERVAYVNCLGGLLPPETATYRNPYREWIGAQIRADVFGWVSPGSPLRASILAYRDARLSHVRNGIYGEMFVSAMIAAACVFNRPRQVILAGLASVPQNSPLADAIRFVLALPSSTTQWEDALDRLHERFGHYHWVHTVNNAALVTASFLYGDGDFEKSICNAVMGGWDTDCNGATVGSVLGTMLGAGRLPERWIAPLRNRIRSSLKGFDNSAIDGLARRTCSLTSV